MDKILEMNRLISKYQFNEPLRKFYGTYYFMKLPGKVKIMMKYIHVLTIYLIHSYKAIINCTIYIHSRQILHTSIMKQRTEKNIASITSRSGHFPGVVMLCYDIFCERKNVLNSSIFNNLFITYSVYIISVGSVIWHVTFFEVSLRMERRSKAVCDLNEKNFGMVSDQRHPDFPNALPLQLNDS